MPDGIKKAEEEIKALEAEKEEAIKREAYEEAGEIKKKQLRKKERIEKLKEKWETQRTGSEIVVGEEEIANLAKSQAKAALVPLGVQIDGFTTIEVERPRLAMMKLLNLFYVAPEVNQGIHPTATVHETAKLGENVQIGPNVVVSRNAVIGDNTKILANSYIGGGGKNGKNCKIKI